MKINHFLLHSDNIGRDSFLWNMAASILFSFQSVIMLMLLTRVLGLRDAGILTIAFANANLFLTVGKYGMRYFQISDVRRQFSFGEYARSRWVTTLAMLIASAVYLLYAARRNSYEPDKSLVILCTCLMFAVTSVEDVFYGLYHQHNRLDVGGKIMTLRLAVTILVFCAGVILFQDLFVSLVLATLCTAVLLVCFVRATYHDFVREDRPAQWQNVWLLLRICFPLFASQFLSLYITNAPKYAIDALLTDELQACYGFIAMPVFVVNLLNGFIFNPMLYRMSALWDERQLRPLVWRTVRQIGVIAALTLVCIAGAWLLGIPVLSWLYNTDLTSYKTELLVLLLGGGFLGLSGFLTTMNTVIRRKRGLMWGHAAVALMAVLGSERTVARFGLLGAAVLYVVLMAALCLIFTVLFFVGVRSAMKERTVPGEPKETGS